MTNIWEKFDKEANLEALAQEVNEASEGNREFKELEYGKYEVGLKDIELVETKKTGKPMIKTTLNILNGEFKGQYMWINQVADTGQKINIGLNFINDMKLEEEVKFTKEGGYSQLAKDLDKAAKFASQNREFVVNYHKNDKGYDTHKIEDVFIVE